MSTSLKIYTQDKQRYLYNKDLCGLNELAYIFEPDKFPDNITIKGVAGAGKLKSGRGNTYFLEIDNKDLVLRHYCRGGLVAKLSYDLYLWTGLKQTRAYAEFTLLQHLHGLGLAVPQVYAARIRRTGLFYRADLVTVRLYRSESLAECCLSNNMTDVQWSAVGALIKGFHNHHVYHADLNAHNILFSEKKCYLIDFDKCELRPGKKQAWKLDNLNRLKRSLDKIQLSQGVEFSDHEWQLLLSGYNGH